jgi:hypothetical protein
MASEPLPGVYPMTLYRGDTRVWELTFTEDDETTPIDMTGKTWLAEIRKSDASGAPVIATIDIDDTDAATGVLVMTLTADEADGLTEDVLTEDGGKYKAAWDLEGTDGDVVRTYLSGKVTVKGDVSRVTS